MLLMLVTLLMTRVLHTYVVTLPLLHTEWRELTPRKLLVTISTWKWLVQSPRLLLLSLSPS